MFAIDAFVILTPFAWATASILAWRAILEDPKSWRNRVSLAALGLLTLFGLLWLPIAGYASGSDSLAGAEVGARIDQFEAWAKFAGRGSAVALVLSLFGRPQLIAPIVIACIGTAFFWYFTSHLY